MAEGCPALAGLERFAAGSLAEGERAAVETHLAHCLACAEKLESLTRAQLDLLVGQPGSTKVSLPPDTSPVLDTVMRQAAGSGGSPARPDPERVLKILDPPAVQGALGTFAGYDVLEIAGRGGMGVVLKARDRTLDRVVAIKVIFPTGSSDESFSGRFLEEARAVAAIQHDHIVTVHHAGLAKGLAYLVMPFHAEGTLEHELARKPKIAPMDVARVGLQLARALAATHAQGILHRDLKPSNVLLEHGLTKLRLADFGLAQGISKDPPERGEDLDGATPLAHPNDPGAPDSGKGSPRSKPVSRGQHARRSVAGTPHYMSPEQARGDAIDARSDLFGLGAVLFQMATGQTLYAGESSREVLRAATRCETKPVRELAPETPVPLALVIDRLLARRPEDRFASAKEVAVELEQFVNAEHRLWFRAKRAAVAALAACVVAGVGVAVLDGSGRTAILNTLRCQRTGDAYYIRGRFGTHARLADALAKARPNEIVEVRFSGERLMNPFQTGGKPLTIRAAAGFTPVLVATNNGQPLVLVDAPLALEGLTLWRSAPTANFVPLISVESAPLRLLNCRFIRSRFQGQNILVWGKPRLAALNESLPQQLYRAMLAFQHGSSGHFRNCLVAGTQASAIGLRASPAQPTRVFAENSLFVSDRAVFMKPEPETRVDLEFSRNVFVTGALLDLDETGPVKGIAATWVDCLVDRAEGALLRMNQAYDGGLLRALDWRETNVVYAGRGSFVINRRRRALDSEAEWNEFMRLAAASHRLIDRRVFPETLVRSSLRLSAADVDAETLLEARLGAPGFNPNLVGEGAPYETFRRSPGYREWRKGVQASVRDWDARRVPTALR